MLDIYRLGNGSLLFSLQSICVMIEFLLIFCETNLVKATKSTKSTKFVALENNVPYGYAFSAYVTAILFSLETFCEFDYGCFIFVHVLLDFEQRSSR